MNSVVAVTGANGFLGRALVGRLRSSGLQTKALVRNTVGWGDPSVSVAPFDLRQPVDPGALKDCRALIHCAYDFPAASRRDVFRINVDGSIRLFDEARRFGIQKLFFISSMSAFAGCRSTYGQAKLEVEKYCSDHGITVIRPGLIFETGFSGGMLGRVAQTVRRSRFLPVVGGDALLYFTHIDDLCGLILELLAAPQSTPGTFMAANSSPRRFAEILDKIADAFGRRVIQIPVPWRPVWLTLRGLEFLGGRPRFSSDSLISLVSQGAASKYSLPTEPETHFRSWTF